MEIKYNSMVVFSKIMPMTAYYNTCKVEAKLPTSVYNECTEEAKKEREVQLILLSRRDRTSGKEFFRIKCPISPLPVVGEFEAPSYAAIVAFLERMGWKYKHTTWANAFR